MKMIIIVILLIILYYNEGYILQSNNIMKSSSSSRSRSRKYLLIKPNVNHDEVDEVKNIYSEYLLKEKSKATIHKAIDVPKLEDISTAIKKSKRTAQSKEFCVRSGGYPNNAIKYDMYKLLTATALYNHDLQKINNKEKVKIKENRCIELKTVRETMVAFGIL